MELQSLKLNEINAKLNEINAGKNDITRADRRSRYLEGTFARKRSALALEPPLLAKAASKDCQKRKFPAVSAESQSSYRLRVRRQHLAGTPATLGSQFQQN
jgi:hypothetical protein